MVSKRGIRNIKFTQGFNRFNSCQNLTFILNQNESISKPSTLTIMMQYLQPIIKQNQTFLMVNEKALTVFLPPPQSFLKRKNNKLELYKKSISKDLFENKPYHKYICLDYQKKTILNIAEFSRKLFGRNLVQRN